MDGFLFHSLCEKNVDALIRTFAVIEKNYAKYFEKLSWINLGGGHHITRSDYDRERLCDFIRDLKANYNVQVILEPGEAVVLNTGYFITSVLDIHKNEKEIAILDSSATAHMPDVLEMPYRPELIQESKNIKAVHRYILGEIGRAHV